MFNLYYFQGPQLSFSDRVPYNCNDTQLNNHYWYCQH